MATKGVLLSAIEKLKEANARLFEKCCKASDSKVKEEIRKQISKNEAMILDYQFRLNYE